MGGEKSHNNMEHSGKNSNRRQFFPMFESDKVSKFSNDQVLWKRLLCGDTYKPKRYIWPLTVAMPTLAQQETSTKGDVAAITVKIFAFLLSVLTIFDSVSTSTGKRFLYMIVNNPIQEPNVIIWNNLIAQTNNITLFCMGWFLLAIFLLPIKIFYWPQNI